MRPGFFYLLKRWKVINLQTANSEEPYFMIISFELNKAPVNCGIDSVCIKLHTRKNAVVSVAGDDRLWIMPYTLSGYLVLQQEFLPLVQPIYIRLLRKHTEEAAIPM